MTISNMQLPRIGMMRTRSCLLSLPLLALLTSLFAAVANGTASSKGFDDKIDQDDRLLVVEDGNVTTETSYNACSLCQGIDILADKIPASQFNPNQNTCAELSANFESPTYVARGGTAFFVPQNATINNAGLCRSDPAFNSMFIECCRAPIPIFECDRHVHDYLFGGSGPYGEYNTAIPPVVSADDQLEVSVFLQFEALEEVEVEAGTATLFVTFVLKWNDPRLQWDIDGDGTCSNSIQVWTGHNVEETTIWIPGFDLMNQIEGIQQFPNARAKVYSDGSVVWIIKGRLKAICNYKGLANIPFDTLGCQLLFGSPIDSYMIKYVLETPDYVFEGVFEETYNKWTLVPELGQQGYAMNGNAFYYDFFFRRAKRHYVSNIMLPTVILTYLSFLTFLLDVRIGERLGFSVALTLVVVAQQIVTTDLTPISNQKLWLDKFVTYSFYFVLLGVIQSTTIAALHYIRMDNEEEKKEAANTEGTPDGKTEKELELQPLTKKQPELENDVSTTRALELESGGNSSEEAESREEFEQSEINFSANPTDEETTITDFHPKKMFNYFVFEFPLRKMDVIAFCVSIASYTVLLVAMVLVGQYNAWPGENPIWFNETTQTSFIKAPFDINSGNR